MQDSRLNLEDRERGVVQADVRRHALQGVAHLLLYRIGRCVLQMHRELGQQTG